MSSLDGEDDAISSGVIESEDSCRLFSLAEIQSMTNHFNDELVVGVGGFGKVYKGFIDNGATTVAIKRLNVESKQGAEEFWTEIKMLSKLRHTHLVALIGYCQCSERQEMILVYEYMARGTLADHLYNRRSGRESGISSSSSTSLLTWEQRLNICISAARGLDYLHTGTDKSIIHRDVKTTNILLDEKWAAKISDFGLSKSTTSHSATHVTTKVKGTFGYFDPNYFYTYRLTKKSDVYAFGVVLLEVLCGRPPVDTRLEEEEISLTLWAQQCIKKGKLDRIVDSSLSGQIIPQSLKYFVEVAYNCLNNHPKERPTMAEVVSILDLSLMSQHKGKSKGIIEKVFQGIAILPKGMNRWWQERKDNVTKSVPSKDSFWKPLPDSVTQPYCRFSLAEIRVATNDFDNGHLIGVNKFSEVYKGCMDEKIGIVAIQRFGESTLSQLCKEGRFDIEVHSLLGNHPNIVSLIGLCNEKPELIAVYDYMANGSLDTQLFFRIKNDPLLWKERLKICIGAARGLQHIHLNTKHRFIHCDIKPSNILLDENWVAKLVQFGLSKLIPDNFASETILVSRICGTYGYMAPEYLMHGILTKKSDVYSFGMVLLEVLCAKKSYASGLNKGEESLNRWFISNIKKGTIDQVIDPYLIGKIAPGCLKEFVNIALSSVLDQGIRRPSMDYVVESLHCALQLQEAWENCIEIGVELPMTDLSCCNIFSIDGDLTIGGLSLLPSNIDDTLTSDFDER